MLPGLVLTRSCICNPNCCELMLALVMAHSQVCISQLSYQSFLLYSAVLSIPLLSSSHSFEGKPQWRDVINIHGNIQNSQRSKTIIFVFCFKIGFLYEVLFCPRTLQTRLASKQRPACLKEYRNFHFTKLKSTLWICNKISWSTLKLQLFVYNWRQVCTPKETKKSKYFYIMKLWGERAVRQPKFEDFPRV